MDIKNLQNNFTTPEQSKTLLGLGVPADSADCYFLSTDGITTWVRGVADKHMNWMGSIDKTPIPCWSVGRLIEISELCYTSLSEHDYFIRQKDCNTDFLIKMFELGADMMDFSKLEE